MATLEITVLGGTRGMGRWFTSFLRKQGFVVHAMGRCGEATWPELVSRCHVVVVSVPIGVTCQVIEKVGPLVNSGSLMMDLTSLKKRPVECMLRSSCSEVVGVHPLFGPDVESVEGRNVVICPARGEKWASWLKGLFEESGANVIETCPERHDRVMAVVQGLTHLTTLTMGLTIKRSGIELPELKKFSTPAFEKKLAMMEKVFGENPRLYAEIIACNPDIESVLGCYESALAELKEVLVEGDTRALIRLMQRHALP